MENSRIRKHVTLILALVILFFIMIFVRGELRAAQTGSTITDEIISNIAISNPGGLYDETILRTIYLEFSQEDWWNQLVKNHNEGEDINILADLTMDGITCFDVGVRFRGMTSYSMTMNSQKKSFNINIDEIDSNQRLMGYKTLNLNNASMDSSFIREVLYFNIFRKYAPCPKANFIKLVINGENWGIYVNVQQHNADLIKEWFQSSDGDRWKVEMGHGGTNFGGTDWGTGGFQWDTFDDITYDDWLATPMAQDMNADGQINEDDYDIYISFLPSNRGTTDNQPPPNMWGGMFGGGMFDPTMMPVGDVSGDVAFNPWNPWMRPGTVDPAMMGGIMGPNPLGDDLMYSDISNDMVPGMVNPAIMPGGTFTMNPGGDISNDVFFSGWGSFNTNFFGGDISGDIAPGGWMGPGMFDPTMMPGGDISNDIFFGGWGGFIGGDISGDWTGGGMMGGGMMGGGMMGGFMMFGGGDGALSWLGNEVEVYERAYNLKSENTIDPWGNLMSACDILNNTSIEELAEVANSILAVDRWLWFLALENIFTDMDSYLTKGADYQIYYEVETGRIHPLQHDGNECFSLYSTNLSPLEGEDSPSRPVLNRLLAIPEFRQRYLAHIRTIIDESFNWDTLAPKIQAYRTLITDEVMVDNKKLYSNGDFEKSFIDFENFVKERRNYLLNHAEINTTTPDIFSVVREITPGSDILPLPSQSVRIRAYVGDNIGQVILHYAQGFDDSFRAISMFDAGSYMEAEIPASPAGSLVCYYVEVQGFGEEGMVATFMPSSAECSVYSYRVLIPTVNYTPVVINELMAANQATIQDPQGEYDDWIELVNISDQEINLSGMYLTDNEENLLKWKIPDGILLPSGTSIIIWADEDGNDEPGLHANFKLSANGEMVMLVDTDENGNTILDSVIFGKQEIDVSYGRVPDYIGQFQIITEPTPRNNYAVINMPVDGSDNLSELVGEGIVQGANWQGFSGKGLYNNNSLWNRSANTISTGSSGNTSLWQPVINNSIWATTSLNTSLWSQAGNNVFWNSRGSNTLLQPSFNSSLLTFPLQGTYSGNQFGSNLWIGSGLTTFLWPSSNSSWGIF